MSSYVGGSEKINFHLADLRADLIADIVHFTGWTNETSSDIVDTFLIGLRKPSSGSESLSVSPDALPLLQLLPREAAAPPKPSDWRSAVELQQDFIGSTPIINQKMRELRNKLIADVKAAGIDHADDLVDCFLLGVKKPRRGQQALAMSQEGVRIAEDFGVLTPRVRDR